MTVWDERSGAGMKFIAKGAVNIILGFINRLIQGWNNISFTIPGFSVPDWVPGH